MDSCSDFVIVCAIDFGTTFSGYAFSFKTCPDDVIINKDWAGAMGFQVILNQYVFYCRYFTWSPHHFYGGEHLKRLAPEQFSSPAQDAIIYY